MTTGRGQMRLPNRRECVTNIIEGGGVAAHATIGFCPTTGEPREIFLRPKGRTGSGVHFLADDVAVLISLALQHGLSADAMRRSIARSRGPKGRVAASLVGAALDLLVEEARSA